MARLAGTHLVAFDHADHPAVAAGGAAAAAAGGRGRDRHDRAAALLVLLSAAAGARIVASHAHGGIDAEKASSILGARFGTAFLHPEKPALAVYLAVLLSVLQGISMRGAKILVSLAALAAGASPFEVGVLAAMFAAFPLLLAVYAGKVSDRIGVRRPILAGSAIIAFGLLVPLAVAGMPGLLAASALVGLGHIFFHVSIHNLIGAYGAGEARTRNFATFALGASVAAFIGPSLGGFSIDLWGFRATHVLLAVIAVAPAAVLVALPRIVPPRPAQSKPEKSGGSLALLQDPGLRRTLLMSGVTLTGIELFTFYFPVYGRAVGLSASANGMVMSSYAVAAFLVRMGMPRATRSLGEVGVLTASLFIAGTTYLLVPFVSQAPLLALIAFLLGIGLGCAQPLTIILTYNHAPAGRSGEALGLRLTVNKLTQIAVPLAFGALGSAFGLLPVFWANGAFLLTGGLLSFAEKRVAKSAPPNDTPLP
jgi:predicted MFS family arabinose efflux permease